MAGPAPESAYYAHRTTAEYLGAAWLAGAIRNGLPFGQLQALIGVDGHPAPELRGLHAWLAVHLPEHADRLIEADPYGVLTYGDAATLPASSCAYLVRALGRLSQIDPWFRSGNWHSPTIGALARPDMVNEFRAVLAAGDAGFGVRSIVVQALALGSPLPAMKEDLAAILVRSASPFAERAHALTALLRLGDDGKASVRSAFHQLRGDDIPSIRLRAMITATLYGNRFGPADVAQLLKDTLASPDKITPGSLSGLSDAVPLADIPAVLDEIEPLSDAAAECHNGSVVAAEYQRLLIRAWRDLKEVEAPRALKWLRVQLSYSQGRSRHRAEKLRTTLRGTPERLLALADYFLENVTMDATPWLALRRFQEATLDEIASDDLLDKLVAHLKRSERGTEWEQFLYQAAFSFIWTGSPRSQVQFETLYESAEGRVDLAGIRDGLVCCTLPDDRGARISGRREKRDAQALRHDFERDAEAIRRGEHQGGLVWAANVYLGLFDDVDHAASPQARLETIVGPDNAEIALQGLMASLSRPDVPSLDDVVKHAAEHQYCTWWLALIAGWTSDSHASQR